MFRGVWRPKQEKIRLQKQKKGERKEKEENK